MAKLLVFGAGYSGQAIAAAAAAAGLTVDITSRAAAVVPAGAALVAFEAAAGAIAAADCIVSTAPPSAAGDPVLARWGAAIAAGPARWLGYLSTTGVYGDHGGAWVNEATPVSPHAERSRRRVAAEQEWVAAAGGRSLDLIRLAGIYGPGRSALDDVRSGRARRVIKPGHQFGRIHRDDIAGGVLAAMAHAGTGSRVLNFADDTPAESAAVLTEATRLLGVPPPPEIPFAEAWAGMSDMARSFWADDRKVGNTATKAALHREWLYPSFRQGLAAILNAEKKQAVLF